MIELRPDTAELTMSIHVYISNAKPDPPSTAWAMLDLSSPSLQQMSSVLPHHGARLQQNGRLKECQGLN